MSTSTASLTSWIRACSPAACRASPTPARCGSPAARHHSARRRRRAGNLSRAAERRGRAGADRGALQALSPRAAPADQQGPPGVRNRDRGRLPLDAVGRCVAGRAAAARRRDRRPLRHELRSLLSDLVEQIMSGLGYSIGRNKPYAGGFITEHYGNPASGLHTVQLETQPGDLYGRAAARARPAICASGRRFRCTGRRAGGGAVRRPRAVPGRGGVITAIVIRGATKRDVRLHIRKFLTTTGSMDRGWAESGIADDETTQKKGPLE